MLVVNYIFWFKGLHLLLRDALCEIILGRKGLAFREVLVFVVSAEWIFPKPAGFLLSLCRLRVFFPCPVLLVWGEVDILVLTCSPLSILHGPLSLRIFSRREVTATCRSVRTVLLGDLGRSHRDLWDEVG